MHMLLVIKSHDKFKNKSGVPRNAETTTASGAEMAKSHLVTVAWQAQHSQCYWEYIYIWELELHLGVASGNFFYTNTY